MKKFMVLALALALSLSLCACGSSQTAENQAAEETVAAVEETAETVDAALEDAAAEMGLERHTAEQGDAAKDTKEAGTTQEKELPPEKDGDKGGYWTAAEWAADGSNCSAYVTITNNCAFDIYQVYISPSGREWGNDVLGSSILEAWRSCGTTLNYNRYSLTYDIKVVDVDGDEYTFWDNYFGCLDPWSMNLEFSWGSNGMTMDYY